MKLNDLYNKVFSLNVYFTDNGKASGTFSVKNTLINITAITLFLTGFCSLTKHPSFLFRKLSSRLPLNTIASRISTFLACTAISFFLNQLKKASQFNLDGQKSSQESLPIKPGSKELSTVSNPRLTQTQNIDLEKTSQPDLDSPKSSQESFQVSSKLSRGAHSDVLPLEFNSPPILKTNEHGNKYWGLKQFQQYIETFALSFEGIQIPQFFGLQHQKIEDILQIYSPEIFTIWHQLNLDFTALKKDSSKNLADFLTQPTTKERLKEIRTQIIKTFALGVVIKSNLTTELKSWLEARKESSPFLMVRSDGIEDSRHNEDSHLIVNAGGNLSEEYIPAELLPVMASCSRVVASNFSEESLRNQIMGGRNPFEMPLQLSVILQELIGEPPIPVGSQQVAENIPVSLVLFTDEPNYSGCQGDFRVTTISCSYGHGSGVVNSEEISTDTIYVVRSPSNPKNIVEIAQIQEKPKRLAPVIDQKDKVCLISVENPIEFRQRRCLSQEMIAKLKAFSTYVEHLAQTPKDIEIVIKNGIIYVVQMRDIKRAPSTPTYLDLQAIGKLTEENPIASQIFVKALVVGLANVLQIDDSKKVLHCQSLKQAEHEFNPQIHQIVVVNKDEPSNSHPVINFSSLGIPSFFTSHLEEITQLMRGINETHCLIVCPQSGQLSLWDQRKDVKSFIKPGYFSHPAYMNISIGEEWVAPVSLTKRTMPPEIRAAIFAIRTASTTEVALEALSKVKQFFSALQTRMHSKIKDFKIRKLDKRRSQHLQSKLNVLERLSDKISSIFIEIEATFTKPSLRLEQLFHIKTLETLITAEAGSAMNTFSLLDAEPIIQRIDRAIDYETKLGRSPAFVRLLEFGERCLNDELEQKWEDFLFNLESANLSIDEIASFTHLIDIFDKTGTLALWLNLVIFPALDEPSIDGTNASAAAAFAPPPPSSLPVIIVRKSISEAGENCVSIKPFTDFLSDMEAMRQSISSLAKIETIELSLKKYQQLAKKIETSLTFTTELSLANLLKLSLASKYVSLMDDAIKTIQSSAAFLPVEKIKFMHEMLKPNMSVMEILSTKTCSFKNKLEKVMHHNVVSYLNKLKEIFNKLNLDDLNQLSPTPDFSVSAANIFSCSPFERHLPQTLEDCFTLIHQNQLAALALLNQLYSPKNILKILNLPFLLENITTSLKKLTYAVNDLGLEFINRALIISYSIPMSNHSMSLQIESHRDDGISLKVKFFGEGGGTRWFWVSEIAQMFQAIKWIELKERPEWTNQEVEFILSINSNEDVSHFMEALKPMMIVANRGRGIETKLNEWLKEVKKLPVIDFGKALFNSHNEYNELYAFQIGCLMFPYLSQEESTNNPLTILKEYGKADDAKRLEHELSHLIILWSKLFLGSKRGLLEEVFDLVTPRFIEKHTEKKIDFELLAKFLNLSTRLVFGENITFTNKKMLDDYLKNKGKSVVLQIDSDEVKS